MKKIVIEEKRMALFILCLVCIIYFGFLLRFYNIDYFVPDFRLYNSMASANCKAADGFSSLFIWMASLCSIMPKFMNFASLAMLCCSIFNILFFYYNVFWENIQKFILVIIMCMSCGAWYYFYGKVFYDVPFSVYNYSLCLLVFAKLYENKENREKAQLWWYVLIYLLGLMMSWKPYNIFMLSGSGLLVLAYDDFRKEMFLSLNRMKKIFISGALFLTGYITGNFNLLLFPRETIEGIKAYPASYVFSEFMLDKHRIIWDHINDLPFSISVFSIAFLIFAGVIWPIAIKKLRYLWISLFMFGALALYISYFSPGYTWHGLSYGFYFVTYTLFLVKETKQEMLHFQLFKKFLIFILIIQFAVNFGYYIPVQIRWAVSTEKAIEVLENKETEIFNHVSQEAKNFGESSYMVECAVKRYRPYHLNVLDFRTVSIEQPYIVAENIEFVDPLCYMNYDGWHSIYTSKNYLADSVNCNYIMFIVPNIFKSMSDVANMHLFDGKTLLTAIREEDYTIYVYKNI